MIFRGLCVGFLFVSWLTAAEPLPLPTNQVTVEMAAPPLEGTVSIGVFDSNNKLVRVLASNTPTDQVPAALNGFLLTWDGRNEEGKAVFKGVYEVRGVTVGNIQVEGVAYYLNDWVDAENAANPPIRTQMIELLPEGSFVAVQQLADEELVLARYAADGKLAWKQLLPAPVSGLSTGNGRALLASNNQITSYDLETGAPEKWPETFSGITRLAGSYALSAGQLISIDPATHVATPVAKLPPDTRLVACRNAFLLVSDGAELYRLVGDHFEKLTFTPPEAIMDLEIGSEGHFWVITAQNSLTEFNPEGEALRNLEPEKEEVFRTISASADDNSLALVSKKGVGNVTRILERTATPSSDVSIWKTKLQKERQPAGNFGLDPKSLRPVSSGSLPPKKDISVSLVANPLSPGGPKVIQINSANFDGGIWISSAEGLPLFPVVASAKSERHLLLRSKKPRELTLFAVTDGTVAEFALRGLENIMQFGGDKVQWPPVPRQQADENNVPAQGPAPTPE